MLIYKQQSKSLSFYRLQILFLKNNKKKNKVKNDKTCQIKLKKKEAMLLFTKLISKGNDKNKIMVYSTISAPFCKLDEWSRFILCCRTIVHP